MKKANILTSLLKELKSNIWNKRYYLMFIATVFISIYLTLQPLFFWKIINELEKYYETQFFDIETLLYITWLWISYSIIWAILRYYIGQELITRPLLINYKETIKDYCKKTLDMTLWEYLWKSIWSIYKLIDRWTENVLFFFFFLFENYLFYAVQIITVICVLFYINPIMALIVLSLLPIMLIMWYIFVFITAKKQENLSKKWEKIFDIVWNAMSNFSLFKTLTLQKSFKTQISNLTDDTYEEQMLLNRYWNISEIYSAFIVMFTRLFVLVAWIYFITQGTLTLWELFIIFAYVDWIYFPLWSMVRDLRTSVKQITEAKRLEETLWNTLTEDPTSWKTLTHPQWNIEFKNVSFGYSQEKQILKNISLTAKKWKKIALVWDTGAGKSTIVNLLLRFWDTNSGEILLDWINIQELSKTSLRNAIWVVSQDNSLFNLSIEENLKFANPKASKKDLEDALKKSEAHFVFDLPNGIKTVIWERGLKLSGGEKQRISIARLFLKNPEILLLDEATSALDNKTEKLIQKSLERLMKGKTSIIIAHRLSTIRHADVIYMLEAWRVVESGNYDELMKKKKKFYELANPDKLILW